MHEITMDDRNQAQQPAPVQAPSVPERGFAEGEHTVLRPVLEADLPELAKLLAENPYDRAPQPWTHQRLKQKFEDKDKPGLWEERKRYFAVVRKQGGLVGFLFEEQGDTSAGVLWNSFHINLALPDRNALGADMLKTYFTYKQRWHDPQRICFSIASVQPDEAQWLTAAGYTLELEIPHAVLYRGEPASEMLFSWISPRLLQLRSDDGPVAGEPGADELPVANGGEQHRQSRKD
jgi:hypothetical protein